MKMEFDHKFVAAFNTFMTSLKTLVETSTASSSTADYEEGYKYIRIILVRTDVDGSKKKSAWGFIDKRTADIFRAASWKAPCLNHIRGNLYDEDNGLKHCHWTGPAYIWAINDSKKEAVAAQHAPEGGI
jgi:hypothetical protein